MNRGCLNDNVPDAETGFQLILSIIKNADT